MIKKHYSSWLLIFFIFLISSGCASKNMWNNQALILPNVGISQQFEFDLLQLTQRLTNNKFTKSELASLLAERAVLYTDLGLETLALIDFQSALRLDPTIPIIHYYLALLSSDNDEFESAFQYFDSAEELAPGFNAVNLGRGIVSYNFERYWLATEDLLKFYKNEPKEPIGLIWLYLAENKLDEKKARNNLIKRYENFISVTAAEEEPWAINIVRFYLGILTEKELLDSVIENVDQFNEGIEVAERLTELYYYLGEYYLNKNEIESAISLFQLSIANNVRYFIEYNQARFALNKISNEI